MTHISNKVHGGMELIDLLLNHTDHGTLGCHGNQPWPVSVHGPLSPEGDGDDFLDTLLGGTDMSSASASPLWSPSPSDSGISEDPVSDHLDSPHPPTSPPFPAFFQHPQSPPHPHLAKSALNNMASDVSIDLAGWESGLFPEGSGIAHYLSPTHHPRLPTAHHPLTVKDLLLSGPGEKAQQNSLQELVLNEDEKKLLAKEGVLLPNKLPLTKHEERVLKKIRRKIRNKQSAQESRKKKREYVDSLEGRMAACSAHNLELQRKVYQMEENNTSLLEQLGRLQTLLPNGSSKTAQTGTCLLVLLLSLSLLLSPSLQPDPYSQVSQVSQVSQGEFGEATVRSRSLLSVEDTETPPPAVLSMARGVEALSSLLEKLRFRPEYTDTEALTNHYHEHNHNHRL